jgi:putative FmdB family regulatory protein
MPIYEYKCRECGTHIEKMQKISDAPLTVCENCGGQLEKQISRSGFQFKGDGWYVTDYSNKGKSDSGTGKKSASSGSSEKKSSAESTDKADSASKTTETKPSSKE